MTKKTFDKLMSLIKKRWFYTTGVIAVLKRGSEDLRNIRLVVAPLENTPLVARNCMLWQDDDILYKGPMDCLELRKQLTALRVCHVNITDYRHLEKKNKGVVACLGNCDTCKRKHCEIHEATAVQVVKTLQTMV